MFSWLHIIHKSGILYSSIELGEGKGGAGSQAIVKLTNSIGIICLVLSVSWCYCINSFRLNISYFEVKPIKQKKVK